MVRLFITLYVHPTLQNYCNAVAMETSGVARLFAMPGQWVGKPFPM